jgi:hypothetical protein
MEPRDELRPRVRLRVDDRLDRVGELVQGAVELRRLVLGPSFLRIRSRGAAKRHLRFRVVPGRAGLRGTGLALPVSLGRLRACYVWDRIVDLAADDVKDPAA